MLQDRPVFLLFRRVEPHRDDPWSNEHMFLVMPLVDVAVINRIRRETTMFVLRLKIPPPDTTADLEGSWHPPLGRPRR